MTVSNISHLNKTEEQRSWWLSDDPLFGSKNVVRLSSADIGDSMVVKNRRLQDPLRYSHVQSIIAGFGLDAACRKIKAIKYGSQCLDGYRKSMIG